MPRRKIENPDALALSDEEREANTALAFGNGNIPRSMTPEQNAELKAHAFFLVAGLRDVDTDRAAATLVRGFCISDRRARELLKAWKKETDAIIDGADRPWLLREMVAEFESSKARGMLLNAFVMDLPSTENMSESRNESSFRLKLAERIMAIAEQIGEAGDDEEEGARRPAVIDTLASTTERLLEETKKMTANHSLTVTQSIRVDNNG